MKKFSYPAIIYYDKDAECYCLAMDDLGIYCDGNTVEEASDRAHSFLNSYLEFAFSMGADIPEPTPFTDVVTKNPKNLVILVETALSDKNKALI